MATTRVHRHLNAPRARVYRALTEREEIVRWKFPSGMSCEVHEFGPSGFRISLTYDAPDRVGKTREHTDTYRGRFDELVPDERVVEVDEFESDDPAMHGEMTITVTLADADADGGTDLVAMHEGLPTGVSEVENATGWREALARLAALVE
jgi:uncharacterized protein YndB with AHSA1/START domain